MSMLGFIEQLIFLAYETHDRAAHPEYMVSRGCHFAQHILVHNPFKLPIESVPFSLNNHFSELLDIFGAEYRNSGQISSHLALKNRWILCGIFFSIPVFRR